MNEATCAFALFAVLTGHDEFIAEPGGATGLHFYRSKLIGPCCRNIWGKGQFPIANTTQHHGSLFFARAIPQGEIIASKERNYT